MCGVAGGNRACPAARRVSSSYCAGPGARRLSSAARKHMAARAAATNPPGNETTRKTCNSDCIVQDWNKLIRLNGVFVCHDSGEKIHRGQAAFSSSFPPPAHMSWSFLSLFVLVSVPSPKNEGTPVPSVGKGLAPSAGRSRGAGGVFPTSVAARGVTVSPPR